MFSPVGRSPTPLDLSFGNSSLKALGRGPVHHEH